MDPLKHTSHKAGVEPCSRIWFHGMSEVESRNNPRHCSRFELLTSRKTIFWMACLGLPRPSSDQGCMWNQADASSGFGNSSPAREHELYTGKFWAFPALALLFIAVPFLIVTRALHVFNGTEQKLPVKPNVVLNAQILSKVRQPQAAAGGKSVRFYTKEITAFNHYGLSTRQTAEERLCPQHFCLQPHKSQWILENLFQV